MADKTEQNDTQQSAAPEKVGVYICHCGGNISDHVDVRQLADNVARIPGVTTVHTNMFMCSDPGQELIQADIRNGEVNRVVVASCAPSLHELTFRSAIQRAGMNPFLYEHANIREQVSWVHHGQQATDKATGLVAAAIAKTKQQVPLDPIRVEARRHVVVIGGGVAGMRAAVDLARRGIEVVLVEKSPFLGGRVALLDTLVPTGQKAADLIRQLTAQIAAAPGITVHTCTEVVQAKGYVGNFKLRLKHRPPDGPEDIEKLDLFAAHRDSANDFVPFAGVYSGEIPNTTEEIQVDTGAIVLATGFQTYMPRDGEYGYNTRLPVITLPALIRSMAQDRPGGEVLEIAGRPIQRVALIHCVGSRQIPGLDQPDAEDRLNEYCSRTCCSATLQTAVEIRERHPGTRVFEFYRDIRTYGRGQEVYYDKASQNNVLFFRFEPEAPPRVEPISGSPHPLKITVKDTLTFGEELEIEVDLVVLAVGMEAGNIADLVEMMKLPVGIDRFLLEVHPKLRPVEVAKTGVFLAGTCQAPMDVGEACNAAQAAAVKSVSLLTKGYVELDPFVAEVDLHRCTGNGLCVAECPIEGAIQLTEQSIEGQMLSRARVNPALCTGCGMCVAVCPEAAVDVKGWTLKQYVEMVDAIVSA